MSGPQLTLDELDQRIAIAEDNLRLLTEQATALSGAGDEDLVSDRIARQQDELDELMRQRDALQDGDKAG